MSRADTMEALWKSGAAVLAHSPGVLLVLLPDEHGAADTPAAAQLRRCIVHDHAPRLAFGEWQWCRTCGALRHHGGRWETVAALTPDEAARARVEGEGSRPPAPGEAPRERMVDPTSSGASGPTAAASSRRRGPGSDADPEPTDALGRLMATHAPSAEPSPSPRGSGGRPAVDGVRVGTPSVPSVPLGVAGTIAWLNRQAAAAAASPPVRAWVAARVTAPETDPVLRLAQIRAALATVVRVGATFPTIPALGLLGPIDCIVDADDAAVALAAALAAVGLKPEIVAERAGDHGWTCAVRVVAGPLSFRLDPLDTNETETP